MPALLATTSYVVIALLVIVLAWIVTKLKKQRKHSSLRYEFQIPDLSRPIAEKGYSWYPSYELMPFTPAPLETNTVLGRTIDEMSTCVGTYGMGGPGYLGFRLSEEWLVISVWSVASWALVDDRRIRDIRHAEYGRPSPWMGDKHDVLSSHLVGTTFTSILIEKHMLKIVFSNGSILEIDPDCSRRPAFESPKKTYEFLEEDDLRRTVFLSPTTELWVL